MRFLSSYGEGLSLAIRFARPSPFTVWRGPVPRHASVCPGNGVGWRSVFARVERSRGTGPRATVAEQPPFHRMARACPSPCLGRGNGFDWRSVFARVERSRGTGPRRASIAGETALVGVRFSRRSNDRGGQALALRARKGFSSRSFRTLMSIVSAAR